MIIAAPPTTPPIIAGVFDLAESPVVPEMSE